MELIRISATLGALIDKVHLGVVFDSLERDMMTYKLDDNGNAVQVDNLQEWAVWYCDNRANLILGETDIKDHRGRFVLKVVTRFRGQVGPLADPARPLVWITEGTDGTCFGAVVTKAEAKNNHERVVRMLKSKYKR